jgi:quinol monooxygenase YgiN
MLLLVTHSSSPDSTRVPSDPTASEPLTRNDASPEAVVSPEDGLDPVMVILSFDTDQIEALSAVLARYVVLSRNRPGCRNIDFVASAIRPGRLVVVEKWASPEAQQAHFDSSEMIAMAQSCDGLLTAAPNIDLLEGVSMHDLA